MGARVLRALRYSIGRAVRRWMDPLMPWVRFDDHFPANRKVDGLSDTAFRLHVSAIFWCARNLTDGVVPEGDLELVTARVRAPARFATQLVERGLWHEAGHACGSSNCPVPGPDGWVIHDYLEYQPGKDAVTRQRKAKAERQARWLAKKTGRESPVDVAVDRDASIDPSGVASIDAAPPRPAPKEGGKGASRSAVGRPRSVRPADSEQPTHLLRRCSDCGNSPDSGYHRRICAVVRPA